MLQLVLRIDAYVSQNQCEKQNIKYIPGILIPVV